MFLTFSILLGYPTYLLVAEGQLWSAAFMFGAWMISSIMLYAIYVGWLQTGASLTYRERFAYYRMGQFPPTRDEGVKNHFAYFFDNIDSIVRDEDIEQ